MLQVISYTSYGSPLYLGVELQGQTVCIQNTPEVYLVIGAEEKLCTSFVYTAMKEEKCSVCTDALLPTPIETIAFCVQRRKNYV